MSTRSLHTMVEAAKVLEPADLAEAHELVRDADGALLFAGGRSKLSWGATPEAVDAVVSTGAMRGLLTHDAGDATASVQAGMRLTDLQEELRDAKQWLAVDPPDPDGAATIGGLLASDDAGPRRLAYGTLRDLVIGVTVVLADGSVGRSGGFVIKNVAGYDLARLFCGSLGTLGFVAEVVVRLHHRPTVTRTVVARMDAAAAGAAGVALAGSPLQPVAADYRDGRFLVRFAGIEAAVDAQVADARAVLGDHRPEDLDALDADDEEWRGLTDALAGADGETVVRAVTLPNEHGDLHHMVDRVVGDTAVDAVTHSHVLLGVHTVRLSGGDAAEHARVVDELRAALAPLQASAVVRGRIAGFEEHGDVWGPPPSAVDLMREVKRRFDPDRRCAPGRMVGDG